MGEWSMQNDDFMQFLHSYENYSSNKSTISTSSAQPFPFFLTSSTKPLITYFMKKLSYTSWG